MVDYTKMTDDELRAERARQLNQSVQEINPYAKMSDEELRAAWARAHPPVLPDVAKSFGVGLGEGAIGVAGLPGDLGVLGAQGINYMLPKTAPLTSEQKAAATVGGTLAPASTVPPPTGGKIPSESLIPFTSAGIQKRVEQSTGPFYQSQTPEGRIARTAGQMAPAMLMPGPEGLISRAATRVVAPTVGSEVAQQVAPENPYAGPVGAMIGALSPRGLGRFVTPWPTKNPEITALADMLESRGVPVSAAQYTARPGWQRYLGKPPGQQEALTAGALQDMGIYVAPEEIGPNLGREVVGPQVRDLSNRYSGLISRNNLHPDQTLFDDMTNTAREYSNQMPKEQKNAFHQHISDIYQTYPNAIPGNAYQEKISALGAEARRMYQSDPTTALAYRKLQSNLREGMERSIARNNPADLGEWQALNRAWAAWKTIQPTLGMSTPEKAAGIIPPQALAQSVERRNPQAAGLGNNPLGEYARAGMLVTGGPDRVEGILGHANLPTVLGALGGAGLGSVAHMVGGVVDPGILGAIAAGPALASGVAAMRPVIGSQLLEPWLKNQAIAPWLNNLDPKKQTALISAALASPRIPSARPHITITPGPAEQPSQ